MKVQIIGEAELSVDDSKGNPVGIFPYHIQKCDGIEIEDEFVEYFDKDENLRKKLVEGYTTFKVENNQIYAVCTYETTEELTDAELEILKEYTQGQWSDGIGEGFEQHCCRVLDGDELYLSPWFSGQAITVTQILN